uniref:hypothetical protein n=1 Tax=Cellulomonas endophytica TaxID=2494735 RepID=UPI00196AB218
GRGAACAAGGADGPGARAVGAVGTVGTAGDARLRAALTVAAAVAGGLGVLDDLAEDRSAVAKGLRGHLGALARGRLTTGGAKVLGIGAGGLVAGALLTTGRAPGRGAARVGADVATSGTLVAASANLVNLLDLRPGRAAKAAALVALALLPSRATRAPAAGVLGAVAAALPADLRGRDMLGDGGANALGAVLGTLVVRAAGPRTRAAVLAALVGLTLLSERVSFTRVIERTPVLDALDRWGRPPVQARGTDAVPRQGVGAPADVPVDRPASGTVDGDGDGDGDGAAGDGPADRGAAPDPA